jgi:hypothetical protein
VARPMDYGLGCPPARSPQPRLTIACGRRATRGVGRPPGFAWTARDREAGSVQPRQIKGDDRVRTASSSRACSSSRLGPPRDVTKASRISSP